MTAPFDRAVSQPPPHDERVGERHLRLGWSMLFVFVAGGLVLAALHALKLGAYLDVAHQVRRSMWILAHAHGALLGLVNVAFAASSRRLPARARHRTSLCLLAASLLVPGGFFLGGFGAHGGDPGVAIAAVPLGGLLLLIAVGRTAWAIFRS